MEIKDDSSIIIPDLISLDVNYSEFSKDEILTDLSNKLVTTGRANNLEAVVKDLLAREAKASTSLPGGIAIPHTRSAAVEIPSIVFARLKPQVNFGSADDLTDLIFLIAAPAGANKEHMRLLSKLARSLVKPDFVASLRNATTPQEIVNLLNAVLLAEPQTVEKATAPETTNNSTTAKNILAITACPSGIAHTYMAADALTAAAKNRNDVNLVVETQGASGGTPFTAKQIQEADAVIFAVDVKVRDRERFIGKKIVEAPVKKGISDPNGLLDKAIALSDNPHAPVEKATNGSGTAVDNEEEPETKNRFMARGKQIQQAIMTGLSYMVPFVAAGGLLIAISFMLGGTDITKVSDGMNQLTKFSFTNLPGHLPLDGGGLSEKSGLTLYLGLLFCVVGNTAMGLMIGALAAYISYGLSGKAGITAGFVGGLISVGIGAGFIGGLIIGLIAGYLTLALSKLKVPRFLEGVMSIILIPLISTLVVGFSMIIILGRPLANLMNLMQDQLNSMNGQSAILLGMIVGAMMSSDLGGPINKTAYLFGTAGLSTGDPASLKIMAAVMAGGMIPPLVVAIASTFRSKYFTEEERESGKTAWLLGFSFITEGAIPFAAADPLRVIPSTMLGGAVGGGLSMALGVLNRAPQGGVFVLPFAVEPWWKFVIALLTGALVGAITLVTLKRLKQKKLTDSIRLDNKVSV